MAKSIFNAYLFRKCIDIFRRKGPLGRETRLLSLNANAGNRHRFSTSLTSSRQWNIQNSDSPTPNTSKGYIINQNPLSESSILIEPSPPPPQATMPILPNHRLLARAFHRKLVLLPQPQCRNLSYTKTTASETGDKTNNNNTTSPNWKGSSPKDHTTSPSNTHTHTPQEETSEASLSDRSKSGEESTSSAISEKDHGNSNEEAKKEHPEAPGPVLGMNDERGGKGQ